MKDKKWQEVAGQKEKGGNEKEREKAVKMGERERKNERKKRGERAGYGGLGALSERVSE